MADLVAGNEAASTSLWKWRDNTWAVALPGEVDGGASYAAAKDFPLLTTLGPGEGLWGNATGPVTLP